MGVPMCAIEFHGQKETFELSSGEASPFGDSPTGDLLDCRVEKRISSDTPAGVFEIHLSKEKDAQGRTWREKIRPQDLVVIQMMNYQGRSDADGAGELHTVMIGFVDTVQIGTGLSSAGKPQRVIRVTGTDFGKIFKTGVVTYWTFLGATLLDGKTAATGKMYNFVDANKLNARPDTVVQVLINDLFSQFMDTRFIAQQSKHSIFEILALQLESMAAKFPAGLDLQFLNGEGNFWSFFTKVASPPFHELWVDTRRSVDVIAGIDPAATTRSAPSLMFGKDSSSPTLIMRPTPFPHLRSNGIPDSTTWDRLRRHVVGSNDLNGEPFDEVLSVSDQEQYNFFLIYPQSPWLPDKPYIMSVPGIIDRERFHRYGFKPFTPSTALFQAKDLDSTDDALGIFYTAMNWRIASWNVLNDLFESGYKTFKLLPHVHVGDRVVDESGWQDVVMEYYVETVIHHFVYNQRATTTLGLTRGLTVDQYANIGQRLLGQSLELIAPSKVVDTYKQLLGVR